MIIIMITIIPTKRIGYHCRSHDGSVSTLWRLDSRAFASLSSPSSSASSSSSSSSSSSLTFYITSITVIIGFIINNRNIVLCYVMLCMYVCVYIYISLSIYIYAHTHTFFFSHSLSLTPPPARQGYFLRVLCSATDSWRSQAIGWIGSRIASTSDVHVSHVYIYIYIERER